MCIYIYIYIYIYVYHISCATVWCLTCCASRATLRKHPMRVTGNVADTTGGTHAFIMCVCPCTACASTRAYVQCRSHYGHVKYLNDHLAQSLAQTVLLGGSSQTHLVHRAEAYSSAAQQSTAPQSTAQHSAAQHSTAQHSTARRGAARHCAAQCGAALHGAARHGTP